MSRRKQAAGTAALAAVVALLVVVVRSGGDPAFDGADAQIGTACGEQLFQDSQTLLFSGGGVDEEYEQCLQALRVASTEQGVAVSDIEAMIDQGNGGAAGTEDLRISVRREPVPGKETSVWLVEFADCSRTLIPLDLDSWSAGFPLDRFLYSPCDEEFDPDITIFPGGGPQAPSD